MASRQKITVTQMQRCSTHHEMGFAALALSILARLQDADCRALRLLDTGPWAAVLALGHSKRGSDQQYQHGRHNGTRMREHHCRSRERTCRCWLTVREGPDARCVNWSW